MKFSQVRMLVDDIGEAFRFYRDELRLEVGFGAEDDPPYASFAVPSGNLIELFQQIPD